MDCFLQGITGSQSKIVNVVSGFDALDDAATATTVHNTLCGTGSDSKFVKLQTSSNATIVPHFTTFMHADINTPDRFLC